VRFCPGHDEILREAGIRFFFTDSHGLLHGTPRPKYGVFAPVYCKGTGVAAFGRDLESSKQSGLLLKDTPEIITIVNFTAMLVLTWSLNILSLISILTGYVLTQE